jgi:hypothetical protein
LDQWNIILETNVIWVIVIDDIPSPTSMYNWTRLSWTSTISTMGNEIVLSSGILVLPFDPLALVIITAKKTSKNTSVSSTDDSKYNKSEEDENEEQCD